MLTPMDIQRQDFEVKLRGYNANEVDDFLDLVVKDYEKLYKKLLRKSESQEALIASLKKQLEALKKD